jgi:hypothetical protein
MVEDGKQMSCVPDRMLGGIERAFAIEMGILIGAYGVRHVHMSYILLARCWWI